MAITYEPITTLIPNTTMEKMFLDGVHKTYRITPNEGYVLHDKRVEEAPTDPETGEIEYVIPWFKSGATTVNTAYDFTQTANGTYTYTDENGMEVSVPVVMIGEYEFYTLPANIVPTSQTMDREDKAIE